MVGHRHPATISAAVLDKQHKTTSRNISALAGMMHLAPDHLESCPGGLSVQTHGLA